jgi:hypothetical protein
MKISMRWQNILHTSHGYFHENKVLIFVRLTDSAYRAIEDFLRKETYTVKPYLLVQLRLLRMGECSARNM